MHIIVTATSNKIDQPFSPRFGRADFFILFDSETGEWEAFSNPAVGSRGGAGPQAVQFIANKGAEVVISGRYGPSAFTALNAAGIKAYLAEDGTVREVYAKFQDGTLEKTSTATGPGLHDKGRQKP
jgi:predicted Fe-Mo cluster-binding NifX family protein